MLTIEGRQVEIELTSLPEFDGLVIPNSLKRKLLDELNWQDFIQLHCRRRNLGFSAQDCFHLSAIESIEASYRMSHTVWVRPDFWKPLKFLRQHSPDGSPILDSAGANSQVSSFDPEIQRGLAGEGLQVFQIMTLIEPDLTKSCKVMIMLERN